MLKLKEKDYNNITCKVELFDEEGTKLSETEGSEGTFEISNVRLWQPLNAYLYKIKGYSRTGCVYTSHMV